MHSLWRLGSGLLVVLGLLVFVAPFLDLPISRRLKAAPSDEGRLRLYRLVIVYLWVMALLSWIFRDGAGMQILHAPGDAAWLFGAQWRTWAIAALVIVFFALVLMPGVTCMLRPHRVGAYTRAARRLDWLLPHDSGQRRWFALLSISAGVCEEWILRGVVPHALHARAGISVTAALVISSVLFGWNHLYQGWKAVGSTAVTGFAFGLVSLLSGGLLLPILLHCAMDLQVIVFFRPDALPGKAPAIAQAAGTI